MMISEAHVYVCARAACPLHVRSAASICARFDSLIAIFIAYLSSRREVRRSHAESPPRRISLGGLGCVSSRRAALRGRQDPSRCCVPPCDSTRRTRSPRRGSTSRPHRTRSRCRDPALLAHPTLLQRIWLLPGCRRQPGDPAACSSSSAGPRSDCSAMGCSRFTSHIRNRRSVLCFTVGVRRFRDHLCCLIRLSRVFRCRFCQHCHRLRGNVRITRCPAPSRR